MSPGLREGAVRILCVLLRGTFHERMEAEDRVGFYLESLRQMGQPSGVPLANRCWWVWPSRCYIRTQRV